MEKRSFRLIGMEGRQSLDPLNLTWKLGVLQVPVMFLIVIAFRLPASPLLAPSILLLFVSAGLAWAALPENPREYEVSLGEERDSEGRPKISYTAAKDGLQRKSLTVKDVKPEPNQTLYNTVWYGKWSERVPVEGVNACLKIYFTSPKWFLWLGFRDANEMNRVFS